MSKLFVCPTPTRLRGKLLDLPRLYAYPVEPELPPPGDGFIILDSGAYAAGGRALTESHAERLHEHYSYYAEERVICIMPDTLFDYEQTLHMWNWWRVTYELEVAPVVQCERRGDPGIYSTMRSMDVYARDLERWPRLFGRPFIAWSNPFMRGIEAKERGVGRSIAVIRQHVPNAWIHVLGAGWDEQDLRVWLGELDVDSVDTIAYYGDVDVDGAVEQARRNVEIAKSVGGV